MPQKIITLQFIFFLFSQTIKQLGSYFQPQNISKYKQLCGLRSDSSHLSVKGVGHFWYHLIILITCGKRNEGTKWKIHGNLILILNWELEIKHARHRREEHIETCKFRCFVHHLLREKCPNAEIFLVRIFMYSDWIEENTDQKQLRIWTIFTQWHCVKTEWTFAVVPSSYR